MKVLLDNDNIADARCLVQLDDEKGANGCGCVFVAAWRAIKLFAVKRIPLLRKRIERQAVTELMDKLETSTQVSKKVQPTESPSRPKNS